MCSLNHLDWVHASSLKDERRFHVIFWLSFTSFTRILPKPKELYCRRRKEDRIRTTIWLAIHTLLFSCVRSHFVRLAFSWSSLGLHLSLLFVFFETNFLSLIMGETRRKKREHVSFMDNLISRNNHGLLGNFEVSDSILASSVLRWCFSRTVLTDSCPLMSLLWSTGIHSQGKDEACFIRRRIHRWNWSEWIILSKSFKTARQYTLLFGAVRLQSNLVSLCRKSSRLLISSKTYWSSSCFFRHKFRWIKRDTGFLPKDSFKW